MESRPGVPFSPRREGTCGPASKERSNFEGTELRAQGKATAGCWKCKAEAQDVSPKMAEPVSRLPASYSEQHLPGWESGEDSWRGGRRLVNCNCAESPRVTLLALYPAAL